MLCIGRAPSFETRAPACRISRLQSGAPTAPRSDDVPLLPSGPGGVHRLLPRRTQPSAPLDPTSPETLAPPEGIPPRCSGLRVARPKAGVEAPLVPRLARPRTSVVEVGENVKKRVKSGRWTVDGGRWTVDSEQGRGSLAAITCTPSLLPHSLRSGSSSFGD